MLKICGELDNPMDLLDSEIDDICQGLVQNFAKVRFLERLGLTVRRKPNGRPLICRSHYHAVMVVGTSRVSRNSDSQPKWGVH